MARPQNECNSLRRRQNLVLILAALLLSSMAHGFTTTPSIPITHKHSQHSSLFASREKEAPPTESWSRRNDNNNGSSSKSRLGVGRRVKNVLKRAKSRTGIQNASEFSTSQSTPNILAESASIGGLGGVVVDDDGTVDVALDLAANGKQRGPEEEFVLKSPLDENSVKSKPGASTDAVIRGDVPAAVANKEPLPFELPTLTDEQRAVLNRGERLQEQTKMGRDGSGYVVVDVKAPEYVVWECLLDFESYTETIPTVRQVTLLTSTHLKSGYHSEKPVMQGSDDARQLRHYGKPSLTRAAFTLSKFRLNIAAIHTYRPHPEGHYMDFRLDPDCTNLVLKAAKGIWYTQTNPEGRGEEYTRVWLLCDLKVSRALPSFIVDYAARRAMPRATTWLKPYVETAASLWLKNDPPPSDPLL